MKVALTGGDAKLVERVVNQGIDPRLEGVTNSKLAWKDRGPLHVRELAGDIDPKDLRVICRRLLEIGTEPAESLAVDLWSVANEDDEDAADKVFDLLKG